MSRGEAALPIKSNIDTGSDEFAANAARMRALADELQQRRAEAALGGPPRVARAPSCRAASCCRATA